MKLTRKLLLLVAVLFSGYFTEAQNFSQPSSHTTLLTSNSFSATGLEFATSGGTEIGSIYGSTTSFGLKNKNSDWILRANQSGTYVDFFAGSGVPFMKLQKSSNGTRGRLGINTTTPLFDLDVNGEAYVRELLVGTANLPEGYVANIDGKMIVEGMEIRSTDWMNKEVSIDLQTNNGEASYGQFAGSLDGFGLKDRNDNYALKVITDNRTEFSIGNRLMMSLRKNSDGTRGRLGINTSTPLFDLDVNGEAYVRELLVGTANLPEGYVASIDGDLAVEGLSVRSDSWQNGPVSIDLQTNNGNASFGQFAGSFGGFGLKDRNDNYALKVITDNRIEFSIGGTEHMRFIKNNDGSAGRLGINVNPLFDLDVKGQAHLDELLVGTSKLPAGYVAAFDGKLMAEEITVKLSNNWPDYVFAKDYDLMSLKDLEQYIAANKHLPGFESATEVDARGTIGLGETNSKLLEKVEELTLYTIQLHKEKAALEARLARLEQLMEANTNH